MKKIIYSLLTTLMVACGVECSAQTVSGKKGGHDYVDLGLPSGRLWATYNVGASKPTEYGDYFAWGETTPKENYDWSTYKWCKGGVKTMTKYCVDRIIGTVDNLTTLLAEDDAATANWGAVWRMPTHYEQNELIKGCDWEWTDNYKGSGVAGRIGTSKTNGNTIFLPASGYRDHTHQQFAGYYAGYWSSSLRENNPYDVFYLLLCPKSIDCDSFGRVRYSGQSVRAVVK